MAPQSAAALREGMDGYTQEFRLQDAKGNIHWMYTDAHIRRLSEKNIRSRRYHRGYIRPEANGRNAAAKRRTIPQNWLKVLPAAVVISSNTGKILYAIRQV